MRSDNNRSDLIQRYWAFSCCFLQRNHSSNPQVVRNIPFFSASIISREILLHSSSLSCRMFPSKQSGPNPLLKFEFFMASVISDSLKSPEEESMTMSSSLLFSISSSSNSPFYQYQLSYATPSSMGRRLGTTTTQLTSLSKSRFLSGLDSERFPWLKSIDLVEESDKISPLRMPCWYPTVH